MAKSVKYTDNIYIDSTGIMHNRKLLSDMIYPVGSLYLSTNSTNPKNIFGGTWEQLTGGYLYANSSYTSSSYTGAGTQSKAAFTSGSTKLTAAQSGLPAHQHNMNRAAIGMSPGSPPAPNTSWASGSGFAWNVLTDENSAAGAAEGHTHSIPAHSHNVAYIGIYVWRRTA